MDAHGVEPGEKTGVDNKKRVRDLDIACGQATLRVFMMRVGDCPSSVLLHAPALNPKP